MSGTVFSFSRYLMSDGSDDDLLMMRVYFDNSTNRDDCSVWLLRMVQSSGHTHSVELHQRQICFTCCDFDLSDRFAAQLLEVVSCQVHQLVPHPTAWQIHSARLVYSSRPETSCRNGFRKLTSIFRCPVAKCNVQKSSVFANNAIAESLSLSVSSSTAAGTRQFSFWKGNTSE